MYANEEARAIGDADRLVQALSNLVENALRITPSGGTVRIFAGAGVLAVDDCEVAAAQFLDMCQSTLFKPVLFNFAPPPSPERIEHVV